MSIKQYLIRSRAINMLDICNENNPAYTISCESKVMFHSNNGAILPENRLIRAIYNWHQFAFSTFDAKFSCDACGIIRHIIRNKSPFILNSRVHCSIKLSYDRDCYPRGLNCEDDFNQCSNCKTKYYFI